jgi:Flp pilus assembly pilin Flp
MLAFVRLQNGLSELRTRHDERGATSVEYALMLGIIAVGCISAFRFFGRANSGAFNRTSNAIDAAVESSAS